MVPYKLCGRWDRLRKDPDDPEIPGLVRGREQQLVDHLTACESCRQAFEALADPYKVVRIDRALGGRLTSGLDRD